MDESRRISTLFVFLLVSLAAIPAFPLARAAEDGLRRGVDSIPVGVDPHGDAPIRYQDSATSVQAEIGYRSNTGTNTLSSPKTRTWDGSNWSSEVEEAGAASPIREVRMAWSPVAATSRIVVTLSDDGNLDAYVCTPTCTVTNDTGQVWTTAPGTPQKRFDVAYEQLSGDALLVYHKEGGTGVQDIAYKTYVGGTWSAEQYLDDASHGGHAVYALIDLVSKKGSDQIGLLGGDTSNSDVNAWIWDGNAFGNFVKVNAAAENPDEEQAAIAWESSSGDLLAVSVNNGAATCRSEEFTTSWSVQPTNVTCGGTNPVRWLSLKANPDATANDMVLAVGDNRPGLSTVYWTGAGWDARVNQDSAIDFSNSRSFDFAWENSGGKGLLVYGSASGQITYRTFMAPSTWSAAANAAMGANTHRWVQLRTNPSPSAGGAKILGAVLENNANDLGAISWDGTAFNATGASMFTADTGASTRENFDLEFRATEPSGNPFSLPLVLPRSLFGVDTRIFILLVAAVGAAVVVLVAARRRSRRHHKKSSRGAKNHSRRPSKKGSHAKHVRPKDEEDSPAEFDETQGGKGGTN